jgi:hypothetical protein
MSVHISAICQKYPYLLAKTNRSEEEGSRAQELADDGDELDSVQFVLQDNKIPIYPYMGRYFAAIGQGRSLVQGQIAINFISEGYLYAVLDNIQSSATPPTRSRMS